MHRGTLLALFAFVLAHSVSTAQIWTQLTSPPGTPKPDLYCVQFFTTNIGFVGGVQGTNGRLWSTANGGTTWSLVVLPGAPTAINDIHFFDNSNGCIVGDNSYIAVTTNGGATWTQRAVPAAWPTGDVTAVYFKDALNGYVVGKARGAGNGPRMAQTNNGGATWTNVALQAVPQNNLYDIDFFQPAKLRGVVVGTGQPPRKTGTINGGATWASYDSIGTAPYSMSFYGFDALDSSGIGYAAGGQLVPGNPFYGEVRKTTDSGTTWTTTGMSVAAGVGVPTGNDGVLYGVIAINQNLVFVSSRNGKAWRSNDGGVRWAAEALPPTVLPSYVLRRFSRTPTDEIYLVGFSGTVLRYKLAPNALFPVTSITFPKACPGESRNGQFQIGNDGPVVLNVSAVTVQQPITPGVSFVVTSRPNSVAPYTQNPVTVRADVAGNVGSGVYTGSVTVYSNDDNNTGADTVKVIPLQVTVAPKTLNFAAGPFNAGRIRASINFSKAFTVPDAITNTGECDIDVTVRLARGVDFTLDAPIPTKVIPGASASVFTTFQAKGPCERYDTVIIEHNGVTPPSPIRIPIVGIGQVQSYATTPADTVDFGSVLLGLSTSQSLLLQNNKLRQLCLDTTFLQNFKITGPNASDFTTSFAIAGPRLPLGPLAEVSIPLTATPGAAGVRVGYAVITHDIDINTPDTIVLIVNGLRPELTTLSGEIRFALTEVGGRRDSAVANFLQNLSNAPAQVTEATITGANADEFLYNLPATSFDMVPGQKQTLNVSFVPTGTGLRTATLRLKTTISPQPIQIELYGNGDKPLGGTLSNSIDFQPTSVNDCRDTVVTQFIFNSSGVPLRITAASLVDDASGSPGDRLAFTVLTPVTPPDLVILPGDSAAIKLRFCPKAAKPYVARLSLLNNSDISPFSVLLTGSGKSSKVVDIDTIAFAVTRVLNVRDSTVMPFFHNRESGAITINSMSISGSDAGSFTVKGPAAPFDVAATTNAALEIRFNPRRRGNHVALLSISTTQGQTVVVLSGRAIYPLLNISPDASTGLRVRVGNSRRLRFNVVNVGDDTGHVESAALSGATAFTNIVVDPVPATMRPGDTLRMFVDFTPGRFCEHDATASVRGEGVAAAYTIADTTVQFRGFGTGLLVGARGPAINFGIRQGSGPFDSTLDDFLGNLDFAGLVTRCLDSTHIDSLVIAGVDAAQFILLSPASPLSPIPLAAGAITPLTIRFQPTAQGLKQADLLVYFEGTTDSVLRIPLLGASALLPIEYGPTKGMFEIDFGRVRLGDRRDSTFTAKNMTTAPLTIDDLASTLPAEMQILFPIGGFQLLPDQPVTIAVRFAPAAIGARVGYTKFRSSTTVDSSFRLIGAGVDDALRPEIATVDFGTHAAATLADTAVILLNTPTPTLPLQFLEGATIDAVEIVSGAAHFQRLFAPAVVASGGRDSIGLRFLAFGPAVQHNGTARVYFDKPIVGPGASRDSFDVQLTGRVAGDLLMVHTGLGAGRTASPGDTVRYPIVLEGDLAKAAFDTLDVVIGFRKTMLKPIDVATAQSGLTAVLAPLTNEATTNGRAEIRFINPNGIAAGTLGDVAFSVMLGDSMETMVRYDSIGAFARPDVIFTTDSARFAVTEFCDARGRLIRFDSALTIVTKPNPAGRRANLSFTLPALAPTRLSVYNAAGVEVARLVDGVRGPGYYIVQFDGTDLAAGTYFCVLTAGRFTKTLTLQILE